MARIKRGVHGLKHRRKVMKLVKGFRAARRRNYRVANEALLHSLAYAYRDRRVPKRHFRSLWLSRINDWVDRNLVDGAVRVVTSLYGALGEGFRRVQQGVIQVYALIVFASVFALVLIARYLR